MTDLSEYMTRAEFAALPSAAHHAVWQAHKEKRIDSDPPVPVSGKPLVYNRAQVLALLAETAATG
ncbi:MAG TPA: hypothetical protein VK586_02860 [Streptosporangiaceae bacterium]|nr:hypothetical protein [Streptosporangiaceae bacterium]